MPKNKNPLTIVIPEVRAKLGLSQKELGKKLNLCQTFIGACERGEKQMSIPTLRVLLAFLNANGFKKYKTIDQLTS